MGHGVEGRVAASRIDADSAKLIAATMQALSTPSRLLILGRLREGACSVKELTKAVGMEQSAVSHQLRLLKHLGLVASDRAGRSVIYALHDDHVARLLDEAVQHAEHRRLGVVDRPPAASAG
jgi:DNA-binding transcriptional ArsR family regulator